MQRLSKIAGEFFAVKRKDIFNPLAHLSNIKPSFHFYIMCLISRVCSHINQLGNISIKNIEGLLCMHI